jgi:glycosyltransferase 2 family protein
MSGTRVPGVISSARLRSPAYVAHKLMRRSIGRPGIFFCIRLGIALALLAIIVRMVDFHHMGVTLASVQPVPIVAGLVIMLLNYCLKTYRWASLLWIRRPDIRFGQLARFNFVSIFLGGFLPGSVSADLVRVYYVAQHTADPRPAISSILADRIIGTFALSVVTIIAFLVLLEINLFPLGSLLSYGIVAFLFLTLALPLTLTNRAALQVISRLGERFAGKRLLATVYETCDHLRSYVSSTAVLIKVLSISFVNLLIAILEFYFIAKAFSAQVPIGYFFVFIPLVIFLATLPLSIGGMGVVEAGSVFFFSNVGMPLEICLGTVITYRALQFMCMLPGAALYLCNGLAVRELSA